MKVLVLGATACAVWSASAPWGSGTASRGHGGFVFDRLFLPLLLSHAYKDKDGQEAANPRQLTRLGHRSARHADQ